MNLDGRVRSGGVACAKVYNDLMSFGSGKSAAGFNGGIAKW
jgi:hypothetical protein